MKLASRVALVLAGALAASACAHENALAKQPKESVRLSAPVSFTSAAAKDSLVVWLNNSEKADGRAAFVVRDPKGRTVYTDSVALSSLEAENPVEVWTPELARERLWLNTQSLDQLKDSIVHPEEAGVGAYWPIEQSEATLERAKTAGRPVLCYVTAPGGVTCAWYDDTTGQGVTLLESAS